MKSVVLLETFDGGVHEIVDLVNGNLTVTNLGKKILHSINSVREYLSES